MAAAEARPSGYRRPPTNAASPALRPMTAAEQRNGAKIEVPGNLITLRKLQTVPAQALRFPYPRRCP